MTINAIISKQDQRENDYAFWLNVPRNILYRYTRTGILI